MTRPLLVALPGSQHLAEGFARAIGADQAAIELRHFPDEEIYLRYLTDPGGRLVVVLSSLDRPDGKVLPLLFAAHAARDLGAEAVGLVAPYLAYMRQDRRFHPGEAITSAAFAKHLSAAFDWLVTVDPHLHRYKALTDIYTISAVSAHAAPEIARWIARELKDPVLIGPDIESKQWVSEVAALAGAPFEVLLKTRHGDRDVEVSLPDLGHRRQSTPVLVDDIVSSGETMRVTLGHLAGMCLEPAVVIAVHGIFAGGAWQALNAAGAGRIVTTNTVQHESNAIDVSGILADAVSGFIAPVI